MKSKFELFASSDELVQYFSYLKFMLSKKVYTKVDEANHKVWQADYDQIKEILERQNGNS